MVLFAVGLTDQISKNDRRFDQQLTNDQKVNFDSIKESKITHLKSLFDP